MEWTKRVFRITHAVGRGKGQGTGFGCGRDGDAALVITCWHVIEKIGRENLRVGDLPCELISNPGDEDLDIALLRVAGLDCECFCLQPLGQKDLSFETYGYEPNGRPLSGILGPPTSRQHESNQDVPAWDYYLSEDSRDLEKMKDGYSGAPVYDPQSDCVVAVITHRLGSDKGFAVDISSLARVYPDAKKQWPNIHEPGPHRKRPGSYGTRITSTEFDPVIQKNLREIFANPGFDLVTKALNDEAAAKAPALSAPDAAALLCDEELELDLAIAWLTMAVHTTLKKLEQDVDLPRFKQDASEALGWLILRAADPDWLQAKGDDLQREAGARIHISLRRESCVEIVLSRAYAKAAQFRLKRDGDWVRGMRGVACGGEAGIAAPTNERELIKDIWREVMTSPVPERWSDDHRETLASRLRARALTDQFHYLTVPFDSLKGPLTEADLDRLQDLFPYLKLIYISCDGAPSALLLNESDLDGQIYHFFSEIQ